MLSSRLVAAHQGVEGATLREGRASAIVGGVTALDHPAGPEGFEECRRGGWWSFVGAGRPDSSRFSAGRRTATARSEGGGHDPASKRGSPGSSPAPATRMIPRYPNPRAGDQTRTEGPTGMLGRQTRSMQQGPEGALRSKGVTRAGASKPQRRRYTSRRHKATGTTPWRPDRGRRRWRVAGQGFGGGGGQAEKPVRAGWAVQSNCGDTWEFGGRRPASQHWAKMALALQERQDSASITYNWSKHPYNRLRCDH